MLTIPVAGPSITEREKSYVAQAIEQAWYADANVFHARFEAAFAAKVESAEAIALPSCTSALHLALAALGVGPGAEVIVPELTWIASAAPINYVGARPVFADVDRDSWCLDVASVDKLITPRTSAIIAVDLYGAMPDYDALRRLASRRGIALIEDAAEAVGSSYRGRPAGSLGSVGVFSFHGSKTMTTGEGGMLVTNDRALAARVRMLRDHGRADGDVPFFNRRVAFKYKMSALQAALGLAQLERLDELVAQKQTIFGWYREELDGVAGVTLNEARDPVVSSYWMTTALLSEGSGDKVSLARWLETRGIDSRPMFHPLSSLPAYRNSPAARAGRDNNRVSYDLSPRGVNLPSALCLTRGDVARVGEALRGYLRGQPSLRAAPRSKRTAPPSCLPVSP
ncbi:MAG: DegT/DnrJ/EryC1/StrS family aminotransferase [Polyangiaceae bacterium]